MCSFLLFKSESSSLIKNVKVYRFNITGYIAPLPFVYDTGKAQMKRGTTHAVKRLRRYKTSVLYDVSREQRAKARLLVLFQRI